MKVSSQISLEIELAVTGQFSPARPATGPSYSSGGDPPEDASVEDVAVEGVGVITTEVTNIPSLKGSVIKHVTTSLLDGVNINSPDIQRLFANLIELTGDDAVQALVQEAGE